MLRVSCRVLSCRVVSPGPEWFLSFLLRALEAYRPLLLMFSSDVQPAPAPAPAPAASPAVGEGGGGGGGGGGWGAGGVDPMAYFARGLTLLARSVLFLANSVVRACLYLPCFEGRGGREHRRAAAEGRYVFATGRARAA